MPKNDPNDVDIYELLSRADELLAEEAPAEEDPLPPEVEDPRIYRNAANRYGQPYPNAANHYRVPQTPTHAPQQPIPIRAYNSTMAHAAQQKPPRPPQPVAPAPPPQPAAVPQSVAEPPKKKKKRGCLPALLAPVILIAVIVGLISSFFQIPKTDAPIGERKAGASAILLCGTDLGGLRTDTMMLLYADAGSREVGLLTLPRDTYTVTDYGSANKLNSAYARNDRGETGMQVLLDYVQDTVGYRPDGYLLIEMPLLIQLIDLMGGVDYNVPMDMVSQDIDSRPLSLQAGMQHLNGEESLALLRFRFGYDRQDLDRQNVQKDFLKACLKQWISLENLSKVPDAIRLFREEAFTDLSVGNFAWFGLQMLRCGVSNIRTDTLPGEATMVGDQSYYVLYPGQVAELIDEHYNPYRTHITREDLDIATD